MFINTVCSQMIWLYLIIVIGVVSSQSLRLISKNNSFVSRKFDVLLEIQHLSNVSILRLSRICMFEQEMDTCVKPMGPSVKITLDYGLSHRSGEIGLLFRLCRVGDTIASADDLECSSSPVLVVLNLLAKSTVEKKLVPYFYHQSLLFGHDPPVNAPSLTWTVPPTHVVLVLHAFGMDESKHGSMLLTEQVLQVAAMGLKALSVVVSTQLLDDPILNTVLQRLCGGGSSDVFYGGDGRSEVYGSVAAVLCCDITNYHRCIPATIDIVYFVELQGGVVQATDDMRPGQEVLKVLQAIHPAVRRHSIVSVVSITNRSHTSTGLPAYANCGMMSTGDGYKQWVAEEVASRLQTYTNVNSDYGMHLDAHQALTVENGPSGMSMSVSVASPHQVHSSSGMPATGSTDADVHTRAHDGHSDSSSHSSLDPHPFHSVFRGVPSRALFSIDYGINIAVLDNVCSLSSSGHRTTLELYTAVGSTESVLSDRLREVLNSSTNSGFYTAHPQQAGWRFVEQTVGSARTVEGHLLAPNAQLFDGLTVALSAPFANNIFHITQVLTTLFYLKLYSDRININHVSSNATRNDGLNNRYLWTDKKWIHHLRRINLPTFSREQELEWSTSLLSAVAALTSVQPTAGLRICRDDIDAYFRMHLSGSESQPGAESTGHEQTSKAFAFASASSRLSVYTAEDYDSLARTLQLGGSEQRHEGYFCYDKLVICGTMELSVAFINSVEDADLFRHFVYSFFDVPAPSPDEQKQNTAMSTSTGIPTDLHSLQPRSAWMQERTPNSKLHVVILLRSSKKRITNMPAVLRMLRHSGLVTVTDAMISCWEGVHEATGDLCSDDSWDGINQATVHVYYFDLYPLALQVRILAQTDVLITPHGAGIMNLIYLQKHSAVIELMTSPWYELGYQATALGMGLAYYVLPVTSRSVTWNSDSYTDLSKSGVLSVRPSYSCPYPVPPECFRTNLLLSRRELVCYNIRLCDIAVDTEALEVLMWQSSQVVRLFKSSIHSHRNGGDAEGYWNNENKRQDVTAGSRQGDQPGGEAPLHPHIIRMYQKAYVVPLD